MYTGLEGFLVPFMSITLVWWIGVGVGAFSAIVHLPIRERQMVASAA